MKKNAHLRDCYLATMKYNREVKEYNKKWPHHCENCGGWGGFVSQFDPSPKGISLSAGYLEDFDPCSKCVEEGVCPRCGNKILDFNVVSAFDTCPTCGWTSEKPEGLPEPPECWCDMRREQKERAKRRGEKYFDDGGF